MPGPAMKEHKKMIDSKWSLVIPCFNEEQNVRPMFEACRDAFRGAVKSYELIFVNDGSRDGTWKALKELETLRRDVPECSLKLVNFSRNFGKESAIYAGLSQAEGEYVTVIDADLQQRPETALEMVRYLEANPETDCVAAFQKDRSEGAVLRFFKSSFYKIINRISDTNFYQGASDFRTFRHYVVDAILSLGECGRFSKGIFSWVGYQTYFMPYKAEERNAGQSSWSFRKLMRYAIGGITAFTTYPLRIAEGIGAVMLLASLVCLIVSIVLGVRGSLGSPAAAAVIVLILLVGGIVMTALGIMGEYIAGMYLQSKNRPIYIAKEIRVSGPEGNRTETGDIH